jgi:hypothetical protein
MSTNISNTQIITAIDKFISGTDCSLQAANEIESKLDNVFPDDDYIQEVVVMLASYRPGGGEYLYDEKQLIEKLINVKERIKTRNVR